jgi:hypothetical protein
LVNAGSGAVRVAFGLDVPPFVVVCAGVVAVGAVFVVVGVLVVAVVPALCAGGGALAAVTVFVPDPHPPSTAPPARQSIVVVPAFNVAPTL